MRGTPRPRDDEPFAWGLSGPHPVEIWERFSPAYEAQLERLIHRGFVTETGHQRLPDLLRYLRAIERRMEKIPTDPNRDRLYMLKVQSVEQEYQQLVNKLPKGQPIPAEVGDIRWMLEELRVSFFAQNLGTPYPISDKRVLQAIHGVKI